VWKVAISLVGTQLLLEALEVQLQKQLFSGRISLPVALDWRTSKIYKEFH
jgi:hypothetical protein